MWLIAPAGVCVLTIVVIAVATGGFGLFKSKERGSSPEQTAQERCASEVLKRLASRSTAKLSDVETARSVLDPDSKDLFSLQLNEPLKGVEHSRITVWNVTGVVDSQNALGGMIHDRFSCRAYFVDGNLADTLVLFDHDH